MKKIWKYILVLLSAMWIGGYVYSFFPDSEASFLMLVIPSIVLSFVGAKKYKKLKTVILILSGLVAVELFLLWYPYMEFNGIDKRLITFVIILPTVIVGSVFLKSVKNFGTSFLVMLGLFFIGIFFKHQHWPGAAIMLTIATAAITFIFLSQMVYSFTFIRSNKLLWIISFICSIIVAHVFLGWLFKLQHWPGAGFFYYNTMHFLPATFIITSIILLIGVQITDFTKWIEEQRNFLVKNILIPWFVVFILLGWVILFYDSFQSIFMNKSKQMIYPWNMVEYVLNEK